MDAELRRVRRNDPRRYEKLYRIAHGIPTPEVRDALWDLLATLMRRHQVDVCGSCDQWGWNQISLPWFAAHPGQTTYLSVELIYCADCWDEVMRNWNHSILQHNEGDFIIEPGERISMRVGDETFVIEDVKASTVIPDPDEV